MRNPRRATSSGMPRDHQRPPTVAAAPAEPTPTPRPPRAHPRTPSGAAPSPPARARRRSARSPAIRRDFRTARWSRWRWTGRAARSSCCRSSRSTRRTWRTARTPRSSLAEPIGQHAQPARDRARHAARPLPACSGGGAGGRARGVPRRPARRVVLRRLQGLRLLPARPRRAPLRGRLRAHVVGERRRLPRRLARPARAGGRRHPGAHERRPRGRRARVRAGLSGACAGATAATMTAVDRYGFEMAGRRRPTGLGRCGSASTRRCPRRRRCAGR